MITRLSWRYMVIFVLRMIVVLIVGSVSVCSYKSHVRNSAFDAIQIGDTESTVIMIFGTQPSVRERPRVLFLRYASRPCDGACVERLWFENRLSLDIEAWSVELDKDRRVINKSRWVSP